MTAQEFAQKWANNASAASTSYAQGVSMVTQSPGEAAAAAADKWQLGVQQAKQKFTDHSRAVSLDQWKQAATQKGSQRYGPGVQQAQGKMAQKAGDFLQSTYDTADRVNQMPSTTLDQRIQKSVEYQRARHQAAQ